MTMHTGRRLITVTLAFIATAVLAVGSVAAAAPSPQQQQVQALPCLFTPIGLIGDCNL